MTKPKEKDAPKNVFKEPAFVLVFSIMLIFGSTTLFVMFFGNDSGKQFLPLLIKISIPFLVWTLYMYLMDCKKYSF